MGKREILTAVNAKQLSLKVPQIKYMESLPVVAAAATLLYTSYKITSSFWKKEYLKYKEIPTPSKEHIPILGHLLAMGNSEPQAIEKVAKWHKELGPIIKIQLGVQTWIFVDDPELAHKIFVTNGMKTSGRPKFVFRYNHYSNGNGAAFSQPDVRWRKARSAVLMAIAPQKVDQSEDMIRRESIAFVNRILHEIDNKKGEMYPLEQIQLTTFNLACKLCLGYRFSSLEDEEYQILIKLIDDCLELEDLKYEIPNFFPILYHPLYHLLGKSKIENWSNEFHTILPLRIEKAIAGDNDCLVKAIRKKEPELTREELLLIVGDFLGGGTDTSLITLLWTIRYMVNYPEVQKKAAAEIANFVSSNGRLPKFNEREQLPYCICVIKESMRLRPTVPFGVPHSATEDIEVDGYFIPKGCSIISSMRSMHQNSSLFPNDPDKFMPERYLDNLKTMHATSNGKVKERDQFNFGWGRRRCPAPYLAEMEIFFIFTALLSECIIEPASSGLPDLNADKKAIFEVNFIKRSSYCS